MTENAKILLEIIREANKQQILIPTKLGPILRKHLGISDKELNEIGEILKADLREEYVNQPNFGKINDILNRMGPENPFGI